MSYYGHSTKRANVEAQFLLFATEACTQQSKGNKSYPIRHKSSTESSDYHRKGNSHNLFNGLEYYVKQPYKRGIWKIGTKTVNTTRYERLPKKFKFLFRQCEMTIKEVTI